MPAPVTQCMMAFMEAQLSIVAWESPEVPRYDTNGQPINPQSTATDPATWPVVTCGIEPPGMRRTWTFADPYDDVGAVKISVYGTTKLSVQNTMDSIEALWASVTNWQGVVFVPAGDSGNPFFIIQMLLDHWWLGQEEGIRLSKSLLCFRGDLVYDPCQIHGAIATS